MKTNSTYGRFVEGYFSTPKEHTELLKEEIKKIEEVESNTQGSEGYGEVTQGSVTRLLYFLGNLRSLVLEGLPMREGAVLDKEWDLGEHSTFLDIGSGYGKVILQVKYMANVKRSVGIECVFSRDQIAAECLSKLKDNPDVFARDEDTKVKDSEGNSGDEQSLEKESPPAKVDEVQDEASADPEEPAGEEVAAAATAVKEEAPVAMAVDTSACEATASSTPVTVEASPSPPSSDPMSRTVATRSPKGKASSFDFSGIEFILGDASADIYKAGHNYSHIYLFDRVFARVTLRSMAKVLAASPFRVMISSKHWRVWWGYGLLKIQPIGKLRVYTTGKECITVFVYLNADLFPGLVQDDHMKDAVQDEDGPVLGEAPAPEEEDASASGEEPAAEEDSASGAPAEVSELEAPAEEAAAGTAGTAVAVESVAEEAMEVDEVATDMNARICSEKESHDAAQEETCTGSGEAAGEAMGTV